MNSMMEIQHRIRQNALLTREYLTDLNRWEEKIRKKDTAVERGRKKKRSLPPVRGRSDVIKTTSTSEIVQSKAYDPRLGRRVPKVSKERTTSDKKSAASHTYDKGYKKWESFDVDAELKKVSDEEEEEKESEEVVLPIRPKSKVVVSKKDKDTRPRTEIERERGNVHFRRGEFAEAIKSYTKAIGHDPKSTMAYSNRAMAHLKLSDYRRALIDCNAALRLDPKYVKALLRRGIALNGLGRHRAALRDLIQALGLSPGSKKLKVELRKTREYVRTSARRAPRIKIPVSVDSDDDDDDNEVVVVGPSMMMNKNEEEEDRKEVVSVEEEEVEEKKVEETKTSSTLNRAAVTAAKAMARISQKKIAAYSVPKTSYEFERVWKSLRSDSSARSKYLMKIESKRFSSIFKHSVEQDIFVQIVETLRDNIKDWNAKGIVNLLLAFTAVKRFDMIVMFLSSSDLATVKHLLEFSSSDKALSKSLSLLKKRFSL